MDPIIYASVEPDARALCKHCGVPVARWTTAEWQRWFHVPPDGMSSFPRRGCRAAAQDRAYAAGASSWDMFPVGAKATPA